MTAKVLEVTLIAKVIITHDPRTKMKRTLNFSDKGPNKHTEYLRYHITGDAGKTGTSGNPSIRDKL